MDITANDINELALKVVEVARRNPPIYGPRIRAVSIEDEAAWNESIDELHALTEWYQPLADKYGVNISMVVAIQQMAVDWVNTVLDGGHKKTLYGLVHSFIDYMENIEDEDDEAKNEDFSDVDVNGLLHEILVMMQHNADEPPPAGTRTQ